MTNGAAPAKAGERPRRLRKETTFVLKFFGLLVLLFASVAPQPMNDRVVEPFTSLVARAGSAACRLFGEKTEMRGTMIVSPRFSVNIRNGCNGLETIFIFASAVLAFPAPWKTRLFGLLAGVVLIQVVNLVRIVTLFFTGIHFPRFFDDTHTVVWQAIVVLFGISLFVVWAARFALPSRPVGANVPR
jgi:exosortase H (IPTLxxWG-CTERM-specific)